MLIQVFHRPSNMTTVDYLNEFEGLYNSIKCYDMKLATGVLAYHVLKNANISSEKQQPIRATLTLLAYECIKHN